MQFIFSEQDNDIANRKWHKTPGGYAYGWYGKGKILAHRLVMSKVLGRDLTSTDIVDHINRDKTDNRRENLRLANKSINTINRNIRPDNTTGYVGVYLFWPKQNRESGWAKMYKAVIYRGGKEVYCKYFRSPEEANEARLEKLKDID